MNYDTSDLINDLNALTCALKDIKRNKATWKKYTKAHKEGRVTDAQLANAKAVLTESTANALEFAMERGLAIGQGESWDKAAAGHAANIIR